MGPSWSWVCWVAAIAALLAVSGAASQVSNSNVPATCTLPAAKLLRGNTLQSGCPQFLEISAQVSKGKDLKKNRPSEKLWYYKPTRNIFVNENNVVDLEGTTFHQGFNDWSGQKRGKYAADISKHGEYDRYGALVGHGGNGQNGVGYYGIDTGGDNRYKESGIGGIDLRSDVVADGNYGSIECEGNMAIHAEAGFGGANLVINGKTYAAFLRRGYNVMAINPDGGKIEERQNFDTVGDPSKMGALCSALKAIHDGFFVIVLTQGNIEPGFTAQLDSALKAVGGPNDYKPKRLGNQVLITVKGMQGQFVSESEHRTASLDRNDLHCTNLPNPIML